MLKLTYACDSQDLLNEPIFIKYDAGMAAYMMDCDEKCRRAILRVKIIELVVTEKDDQAS